MSAREQTKTCHKCKETEKTSFSSCRFCGATYGQQGYVQASKMASVDQMGLQLVVVVGLIGLGVGGFYGFNWLQDQEKKEMVKPIATEVKAAGKPRMIQFFSEKATIPPEFEKTLQESEQKYLGAYEVQRINIADPQNATLVNALKAYSVPRTLMFDKTGALVADMKGVVPGAELNGHIEEAISKK